MKPTINLPTFQELAVALDETNFKMHASEVHGLLCGLLSGKSTTKPVWEELVTGGGNVARAHVLLQELYDMSAHQLDEFLFEMQLLLPDDLEPLTVRAEALTVWCQGFLTGLKLANVPMENLEPSEMTEAINDIIEIAQMNYESVEASEEDETAYIELVEFVRVAALLIYQEMREGDLSAGVAKSKHVH